MTYEANRKTKVDLVGTPMMPRARRGRDRDEIGRANERQGQGQGLTPAGQFGPEYLTYTLWAIPPQGRPKNLGEIRLDDGDSDIEATVDVQTFSLIVAAEPYYAVTRPSEVVVMENLVREETNQKLSQQRADAVGQYLRSQGIPNDRITTKGDGPSLPVASNDTREGRSQNRRVELVVAGDIIGTPIGATSR